MNDNIRTNAELIETISALEQRIRELEQSQAGPRHGDAATQDGLDWYQTLVENANDFLYRTDSMGRFTFINPAALYITGFKKEEMLGKHYLTMIRPDMHDKVIRFYGHQFVKKIQNTYFEFPIITKDGREIWIGQNSQSILENGQVAGFQAVARDITDRRKMEEALLNSEEKYRFLFESAAEGILIVQGAAIRFANPALAEILGYPQENITSRPFVEFIHPEDRSMVMGCHLRRMQGKDVETGYSFRIIAAGGVEKWLQIYSKVIPWEGVPSSLSFVTDITDRMRAEAALRENEERFRLIMENINDTIWLMDMNIQPTWISPSVEQTRGYSLEELRSLPLDRHVTPESLPKVLDLIDKYLTPDILGNPHMETNVSEELEFYRKDGTTFWADTVITLLRNEQGLPVGFLGVSRDTTERRRMEKALLESEERFRLLAENARDCIWTTDMNLQYTYMSPYIKQVLDYTPEEYMAIPIHEMLTPASLEVCLQALAEELENEKKEGKDLLRSRIFELEQFHRNGSIIWTEVKMTFMRNAAGEATGILGYTRDITERKRAEEEKLEMEKRLQQAQKLESIGTLAGGIAHDFNNLLMGIQGYASLTLLDLDPSHPHYERLKRIEQQIQSGADLTKQLLGFARGGRYEARPTDMNEIIDRTAAMFGRTKKEISVHRSLAEDLWTVEVDQGQMEQVFMNLYVNAWQAMPGGGEIFLETGNVLLGDDHAMHYTIKPGRYVKITVTDTGTGMDAKTRERIFDPFFTTKAMGRGTGLGLAMVYGIVKGHGGMIDVVSAPGQGTTFDIYLPATEKAIDKKIIAAREILTGTETILLVDDEQMVLEVTRELLESLGYRVYAAGNGQEAIAVYMEQRDEIDLVILDMIMPGISGGETFDRLKEINPEIRVLLSSGYSINGEAREILDRGCDGFLQKPFQLEKLSQKVREAINL